MDKLVTAPKPLKVIDGEASGDETDIDDFGGPIEPVADRPNRAEAEEAVRTLIKWAGDDPAREGLRDRRP